jgi:hypothetical protein
VIGDAIRFALSAAHKEFAPEILQKILRSHAAFRARIYFRVREIGRKPGTEKCSVHGALHFRDHVTDASALRRIGIPKYKIKLANATSRTGREHSGDD